MEMAMAKATPPSPSLACSQCPLPGTTTPITGHTHYHSFPVRFSYQNNRSRHNKLKDSSYQNSRSRHKLKDSCAISCYSYSVNNWSSCNRLLLDLGEAVFTTRLFSGPQKDSVRSVCNGSTIHRRRLDLGRTTGFRVSASIKQTEEEVDASTSSSLPSINDESPVAQQITLENETRSESGSKSSDLSKELSKAVKKTASTFAPRASAPQKNPAVPGTTLYTVFEVQGYLSMVLGGLLSFNLVLPSDEPDIWRLMGMWSVWMFTIPSLRARDCSNKEKDALNYLFLIIPLINILIPFFWKSFAAVWSADILVFFAMYAWKLNWIQMDAQD